MQQIFSPVLKLDLQSKDAIEDELDEFSATKVKVGAQRLREDNNKKHLERLHNQLPSDATLSDKIEFFTNLAKEKLEYIASRKAVYGDDINTGDLLLTELGRLTSLLHADQLFAQQSAMSYRQLLEFLLRKETSLTIDKKSIEYHALNKTDFFFRLRKQIELMRELVAVEPKAQALGLLGDISTLAMMIQGRAWVQQENHLNDYLADLLRAKQYEVSDQTRNGLSGSQQGSGLLDIAIRDSSKNGIIVSIIESFFLESCGPENKIVGPHLKRLIDLYDSAGNAENFAVVFARAADFDKLWLNYKQYVDQVVFGGKNYTVDYELDWLKYDKVKLGVTEFQRGEHTKRLVHVFINLYKSKSPVSNATTLQE